ncbi:MAG: YdeI/OmpD-associated family protein [Humibacillus sp.]
MARTISCEAEVVSIDDVALVKLPATASAELPSRGQVAVQASIEGHAFDTVVEPDGRRGHWVRLDARVLEAARLTVGDNAALTLTVAAEWPEPEVPDDLATALSAAPQPICDTWHDITPMARWEWVRWVGATRNPATRERRVEVSLSKLDGGTRRPCCFDLASCTDPELARSGRLREPT